MEGDPGANQRSVCGGDNAAKLIPQFPGHEPGNCTPRGQSPTGGLASTASDKGGEVPTYGKIDGVPDANQRSVCGGEQGPSEAGTPPGGGVCAGAASPARSNLMQGVPAKLERSELSGEQTLIYRAISSIWKASIMSPSLMSLYLSKLMPHSKPCWTSRTSSLKRLSDDKTPS